MGQAQQDSKAYSLPLIRPLMEFGVPCDAAGFTGNTGIHFDREFTDTMVIGALPVAAAGGNGAQYLSGIHGSVGSDPLNPLNIGASDEVRPAFSNPEVTGFYVPPAADASDPKANGFQNTEKVQRSVQDGQGGAGGTIWTPTFGALTLSCSLNVYPGTNFEMFALYIFRDCNVGDKVNFVLGTGSGPTDLENAQPVATVGPFVGTTVNATGVRHPTFATPVPIQLPASTNLYFLLKNLNNPGTANRVMGSIYLRG